MEGYKKKIPAIKKKVRSMVNLTSLTCNILFLYFRMVNKEINIIAALTTIIGSMVIIPNSISEPGDIFLN
jgi:hypothetical protein